MPSARGLPTRAAPSTVATARAAPRRFVKDLEYSKKELDKQKERIQKFKDDPEMVVAQMDAVVCIEHAWHAHCDVSGAKQTQFELLSYGGHAPAEEARRAALQARGWEGMQALQRAPALSALRRVFEALGLPLVGHHHLGIDDARNIASILVELVRRGARVEPTGGR